MGLKRGRGVNAPTRLSGVWGTGDRKGSASDSVDGVDGRALSILREVAKKGLSSSRAGVSWMISGELFLPSLANLPVFSRFAVPLR